VKLLSVDIQEIKNLETELELRPFGRVHYLEAQKILNDGSVLEYASNYIGYFVVNENANIKAIYLALLNKGNQIIVRGESSQGKTHVVKCVLKTIPENRFYDLAGFSKEAPKYLLEELGDEYDIIYLKEDAANPEDNLAFRFSSKDDGGGSFVISQYNTEIKQWIPTKIKTKIFTFITTSVKSYIDAQALTRSWEFYIDSSVEQTKNICNEQANNFRNADKFIDRSFERKVLWAIYEEIRKQDFIVICPFYDINKIINMPFDSWYMRRDNPRIIEQIKNIAKLNYKKRVSYSLNKDIDDDRRTVKYLIADIEDIITAFKLLNEIKTSTGSGLSKSEEKMLDLLKSISDNEFGCSDVIEAMKTNGWYVESQDYVNRLLNKLHNKGFLYKRKDTNDRRGNLYWPSDKKRNLVSINYESLEKQFYDWLDEREEDALQQIQEHSLYLELVGKSVIPKESFPQEILAKNTDQSKSRQKVDKSVNSGNKKDVIDSQIKEKMNDHIEKTEENKEKSISVNDQKPTFLEVGKNPSDINTSNKKKKYRLTTSKMVVGKVMHILTMLELEQGKEPVSIEDINEAGLKQGLEQQTIKEILMQQKKDGLVIFPKQNYVKLVR